MTSMPPCPEPCPHWCTRESDHGLYFASAGEWRRIHLGDSTDTPAGPVYLMQSDVVDAVGATAGQLYLATDHGELAVKPRLVA